MLARFGAAALFAAVVSAQQQLTAAQLAAQQQAQQQQWALLSNLPAAHPDVVTASLLPKSPENNVAIGDVLTVACSFINNGESPLNISGILGSLNDPLAFGVFYENFTGMPVGEVVEPGGEVALEYRIMSRVGETIPAQLAVTVFYEDAETYYSSTFFNQTIFFTKGKLNTVALYRTYAPYALGLAVVAAVLVFVVFPILFGTDIITLLPGASNSKRAGASESTSADKKEAAEPTLRSLAGSAKGKPAKKKD